MPLEAVGFAPIRPPFSRSPRVPSAADLYDSHAHIISSSRPFMQPTSSNPVIDTFPPTTPYWPTASELDQLPGPSNRGPFQETYFEKLVRAREIEKKRTASISHSAQPQPQVYLPPRSHCIPQSNMQGPVFAPAMPAHPWQAVWDTEARQSTPVMEAPIAARNPVEKPGGNKFNALLQAKLAAERRSDVPASVMPSFTAPPGMTTALSKLEVADTVVNRSFASRHYVQPVDNKPCPPPIVISDTSMTPKSPMYASSPVPPLGHSPATPNPAPFLGMNANMSSEQVAANFRSIITDRINTMYASTQGNALAPPANAYPAQDSQLYWSGGSSSPASTMPITPTTPVFKAENNWNMPRSPIAAQHSEMEWQPTPNICQTTPGFNPSLPQQPFVWNITPPSNPGSDDQPMPSLSAPSLHAPSDSIDSINSPMTPQMASFRHPTPILDIKPLISPALSTITLPEESSAYPRYGQGLFINMNGSPVSPSHARFIGASTGDGQNGNGAGDYYQGGDGLGDGGLGGDDNSNLNGLGFGGDGSAGDGSGGDGDQNGDDQGDQQPLGTGPRSSKGKKLSLACHFCRRRKLKCDGVKPSCDNCNKRGVECSYDDSVRRRGPGRRTKEMRDRAAREAEAAGLVNSNSAHVHPDALPGDLSIGDDFHLDPVLSGHQDLTDHGLGDHHLVDQGNDGDVMDAMDALKQAGVDLGIHDPNIDPQLVDEPSTLAQISALEGAVQRHEQEMQNANGKRELEEALEQEGKRQKLEEHNDFGLTDINADSTGLEGLDVDETLFKQ